MQSWYLQMMLLKLRKIKIQNREFIGKSYDLIELKNNPMLELEISYKYLEKNIER